MTTIVVPFAEPSPTQLAAFALVERLLACPCEGVPLGSCAYCASLNVLAEAAYYWKETADATGR